MYNSYISVDEPSQREFVINRSRFITTLVPIENMEDAEAKIALISKKYSDATHNCYAFISNTMATEQRFSDNGEPGGTAGVPMLEVLKKRGVYMTLAVVTRYFGGIKLGAGGLVSAYSRGVAEALDNAHLVENVYSEIVTVDTNYTVYKKVESYLIEAGARIIDTAFSDKVVLTVQLRGVENDSIREKIIDMTLGQAVIDTIDTRYCTYEITK